MESLEFILSAEFLMTTIRLAIPIGLAAIGGTICERGGIVNLGIEGMMLFGAFAGVLGSHLTGNPWLGVLMAIAVGGFVGLIHGILCIKYKTNQSVSGVGINILATGLTVVLTRAVWQSDGISGTVTQLANVSVPVLKDIPFLGVFFTNQSPIFFITIAIVVFSWFVFYKTKTGIHLIAIGDHPQAASTVGIDVKKYRYCAVIICGMLCGLAGAYLSIVQNSMFINNMVAGRGFMALAANIFGGWNPVGSFLASIVFAFSQALSIYLKLNIPDQFIQMLPYVLTLLVLIGVGRKVKSPEALGKMED